jgi:hypothetical protein
MANEYAKELAKVKANPVHQRSFKTSTMSAVVLQ